jgi:LPS export ABC transporter permease LptF/LPS export ABC transporter permease LptG
VSSVQTVLMSMIGRYILKAILPYTVLALVVLSFILLAQQFSRFAEILEGGSGGLALILVLAVNLVPNVLVFTLPMAMLVGTATGFCRMGSESELTAMRAAGAGNLRIITPVIILGLLISILGLYVSFVVAPASVHALRDAALGAAIKRLESPVDPRSFYTEMPGKVIYVRDGDRATGQWGRVFIHWQETGGQLRLVTARSGRIDTSGDRAELVLSDAMITTLPPSEDAAKSLAGPITTERSAQLRLRDDRLSSLRTALIERIRDRDVGPDEMRWRELREQARSGATPELRRGAEAAFHKKLSLSLAPIAFAFLGAGMGLRVRRGGRTLGIALSMGAMLLYYLVSLAGEQLAKGGAVPAAPAIWAPFLLTLLASAALLWRQGTGFGISHLFKGKTIGPTLELSTRGSIGNSSFIKGLLNKSVLSDLVRYFSGTFVVLMLIFMIFTLFELLRFIVINSSSWWLIAKYLFFLAPLIAVTIAPMCVLLAVLITFTLMIRRSEIIAWWGSGQSIYRLVLPAFAFAIAVSLGVWAIQEQLMPGTNKRQNQLRSQIRGGVTRMDAAGGRRWMATENTRRVYTYFFDAGRSRLDRPTVFEFDEQGIHLVRVWWSESAEWVAAPHSTPPLIFSNATMLKLGDGRFISQQLEKLPVAAERQELFKPPLNDPAEMNAGELSAYINVLKAQGIQAAPLMAALERKRAGLLAPLVMVLIGAPASLAFGRRSTVAALFLAVVLGVIFWGVSGLFNHFGAQEYLPPPVSAWVPPFLFALAGTYLLLRVKT